MPEKKKAISIAAVSALSVAPGETVLFVRWADAIFAPGAHLDEALAAHRALTARMHAPDLTGLRWLRTLHQPNGFPLVELWTAHGAVDAADRAMGH